MFQYFLNSDGFIHNMRAVQGHSGGYKVDPSPQFDVEISYTWIEYITLVLFMIVISFTNQGLIAGGKIRKKEDKQYSSLP